MGEDAGAGLELGVVGGFGAGDCDAVDLDFLGRERRRLEGEEG